MGHLQDQHAVRVAQDLVGVRVEAVADVGGGDKQGKGVLLLRIQQPALRQGGARVRKTRLGGRHMDATGRGWGLPRTAGYRGHRSRGMMAA